MKVVGIFLIGLSVAMIVQAQDGDGKKYSGSSGSWKEQVNKCDVYWEMNGGETCAFSSFPARVGDGTQSNDKYELPSMAEEEQGVKDCKWKFSTKDSCELELHVQKYEKGSAGCGEQYMEISDESSKIRVCGGGRPPPNLKSSGKELTLEHFHHNDNYPQGSSYMSGYVTCANGNGNGNYKQPDYTGQNYYSGGTYDGGYYGGSGYYTSTTENSASSSGPGGGSVSTSTTTETPSSSTTEVSTTTVGGPGGGSSSTTEVSTTTVGGPGGGSSSTTEVSTTTVGGPGGGSTSGPPETTVYYPATDGQYKYGPIYY